MVRAARRRAGDEVIATQIGVNTNRDRFLANGGMHHSVDVAGQRRAFEGADAHDRPIMVEQAVRRRILSTAS
jgi:hypothetical protein